MILTGRDVQWYVKMGKLMIEPVTREQYQQNGVDLILESIGDVGPASIVPAGDFRLGCTRELICMPDDLMAFVQLRSTWARQGILVPPTAVDAGFQGNLTLEIVFHREQRAPLGQRFVHLIFARLTGPTTRYSGKYQGQSGITGAIPD